ncbi:hypothetical protein OKW35_009637 [Paraburkholderia sp. MM5477-R1]
MSAMRRMALGKLPAKPMQPGANTPLQETTLRKDVPATRRPLRNAGLFKLYSGLMLAACRPFGPCFVSKLTF